MKLQLLAIERFDLKYIYHHLKVGSELELDFHGGCAWIYFKGFKLGFIDSSKVGEECIKSIKVSAINKKRFLLPTSIMIEIER